MTNAQKWVGLFLILFIVLFALTKLTKTDKTEEDIDFYGDETTTKVESKSAETLMQENSCYTCHRSDLSGSGAGPELVNLSEHYSRDQLINYLRNPDSYSGDDRFESYKEKYKQIMPSYNHLDVKDLGKIADYLLSLDKNK